VDWFWEASWRESGRLRCRRFFIGRKPSYREAMRLAKEARAKAMTTLLQVHEGHSERVEIETVK
jgi:hypothetical protein